MAAQHDTDKIKCVVCLDRHGNEHVERLEHKLRYAFMICLGVQKNIRRDGNYDTSSGSILMPMRLRVNTDIMASIATSIAGTKPVVRLLGRDEAANIATCMAGTLNVLRQALS